MKWFVLAVLTVVMVGCSTLSRSVGRSTNWSNVPLSDRYDSLRADTIVWETISFSGKVNVKSPESNSCSARLFMYNDSLIHISLRAYGVEGAVVRMTRDSVSIYNKIDKVLVKTTLNRFLGNSGYSLNDIQDILLGRVPARVFDGFPAISALRGGAWKIATGADSNISAEYLVNAQINMPSSADFTSEAAHTLIRYGKWNDAGGLNIPEMCELTYTHRGVADKYAFTMKISSKSLKINQGNAPKWHVAKDAAMADFDQLYNQFITTKQ
ncbi:MAG: DUF4292 domain-containing protein [Muribaculaceae bacterium]|nr:DUF4292 domain-containing protein [Muribaculaceae bacterium]